jgi:predicted amidohydrolase YtcJ
MSENGDEIMSGADIIFTGGRIWRGLGLQPATSLAIANGIIVAVGDESDVAAFRGPATRDVQLAGRLATPGLIDSHIHILPFGVNMLELNLRGVTQLETLLERVRDRAAEVGPGKWIKGVGHDDQMLDVMRHPTIEELDAAAPHNPVYLVRTCAHVYQCNSMALAGAHIDFETPVPTGGIVGRRAGKLSGFIAETARELIKRALPKRTVDEMAAGVMRGCRLLASKGVTGIMEAGVGRMTGDFAEFEAFRQLADSGDLPVRVCMAIMTGDDGIMREVREAGFKAGEGGDLAWIGPAKFHTDGSAGGQTAAMTLPYSGNECSCGTLIHEDEVFFQAVRSFHDQGFQIAVHAIGDRAIDQVIATMERINLETPVVGRRHRIEHCGFVSEKHVTAMRKLGLIASPQPVFMYNFGDVYTKLLTADRANQAYPLRTFYEAGLMPAVGTDAPVCIPDVMTNFYNMLTRRTASGAVVGESERVDIEVALFCYTEAGAFAQFQETRRGTLEVGKDADVAVFSRDFTDGGDPALLFETECDLTLLAGRATHDRLGELAG